MPGCCKLLCQYILEVEQLKKMILRSAQTEEFLEEGILNEFYMVDSICAEQLIASPLTLFAS